MPWEKGQSGNPNGRPRKAYVVSLQNAIEEGEKKFGKPFFRHAIERAFKNDTVLIAILKKLVPDKIKGEGFNVQQIFYDIKQMLDYGYTKREDNIPSQSLEEQPNRVSQSAL